jgi:outer membrane biogenesis lipoprotein LolB
MYKKAITILSICFIVISCKGKKEIFEIEDAATAKVVANHYSNAPSFETMTSRMKLRYQDEERSQSVTVSFRMKKDSAIWMSAQLLGIPLAKVLITRDRVSYYEKIGKTYFDGDYRLVSNWLGTPLDYEKLQNLLLGQAIYDLRNEKYKLTESTRGYQLVPSRELDAIKKMFLLDPRNFMAIAQQLSQEKENRNVTVSYPKYQNISGRTLPEDIKIVANSEGKATQVEVNFRSVNFNEPVSFPFDIPSGYEEIEIE